MQGAVTYDHNVDRMEFRAGNSEKMYVFANGDVGIGTSGFTNLGAVNNPALGLYSSGGARLGIFGNGGRWWYANAETVNAFTIGYRASSNTVDNSVITALTTGNVGIGTISPSSPLTVNDSSNTNPLTLLLTSANSNARLYIGYGS